MDTVKTYKKGEVIFREGTFEMCMYDLLWGTVGIYVNYGQPNEKQLSVLRSESNDTFGEMGLIDAMPRSATAVALDSVKVCVITSETFGDYFREKPATVMKIMQSMSYRIRSLTRDYLDACRAVAEAEESSGSGREKSSWFVSHAKKFIDDFRGSGAQAASSEEN